MNEAGKVVQNLTAKKLAGKGLSDVEQKELRESSVQFTRYQKAVLGADASIGRFQRNVGNYPKALNAAAGAARNLASAFGVFTGTLLVANTIRNGIKTIREFEKSNATLSAVLQVSKENMKDLKDESIRLGSTTVKTASQVAELQIAYARLGFEQAEIIDLTEATIAGSIAMNSQLDKTAELTGAVVNTFDNLSTTDAPMILDILSLSTAKSALNFEKLEKGIPIVAGAANAAGVPFTKLVALLGKLADSGIDVSSSSTALRNIFIESAAQGLNYSQILEKIKGSQDKLTASNDEFGKRAAVSATVLSSNIEAIDELDESLQNAAGTAERMANKELDTLDGSLQLLKSAWEGFILQMDETNGVASQLKDTVSFLANNLTDIISVLFTAVKVWTAYKVAVFLANAQQGLMNKAMVLTRARSLAMAKGVSVATFSWKAFNTALKANALFLAIGAIVGLIAVFKKLNVSVTDTIENLHEANKEFIEQSNGMVEVAKEVDNLIDRYDELKDKTNLNKDEQTELNKIIKEIAKSVPDAVTEIDKYGNALDINAEKARNFSKDNGKIIELEADIKLGNLNKAKDKIQKEIDKVALLASEGNSVRVDGLGVLENIDGQLKKVTTTFTKSGRAIISNTDLTKEQRLQYEKYVKSLDDGLATVNKDIAANEDLIGSISGVKTERQKQAEAQEKAVESAEKIKDQEAQQVLIVKQLKSEIAALNSQLKDLTKDGYDNLTQAQADAIKNIRDEISAKEKELKAITGSTEAREKATDALKGSLKYFEDTISKLESQQSSLARNGNEWLIYERKINEAKKGLETLQDEFLKVQLLMNGVSNLKALSSMEESLKRINEIVKDIGKSFEIEGIDYDGIKEGLDKQNEAFREAQQKRLEIRRFYAQQREELEQELNERIKDLAFALGDAIFQQKLKELDQESQAAEKSADRALQFAGDSAEAKAEIERQLAEKQEEIQRKRIETERQAFLFQQAFKLGEIAIDTIQAVAAIKAQAAILAANPVTAALASVALAQIPLVITSGAIAGAAIVAQTLPAFAEGGNAPGGPILVNDAKRNNFKEVLRTPKGEILRPQKKNTVMDVPKGTQIFKSERHFMDDLRELTSMNGILFNQELMNPPSLQPVINIESGFNKQDFQNGINDLKQTISGHTSTNISIDKNGVGIYQKKGHARTNILNNRFRQKGKGV